MPLQALELIRALAAHCPSVAESAALWGPAGLPALSAHLRPGHDTALREAAAAALDAILRLHKTQAVKEVLAKGMRIRGLLDKYGARIDQSFLFLPASAWQRMWLWTMAVSSIHYPGYAWQCCFAEQDVGPSQALSFLQLSAICPWKS